MDIVTWLISTVVGIAAGLLIVGVINWHTAVQFRRSRKPDCYMLHSIATSEITIYGKIVSPDVKEHVATCLTWAIATGMIPEPEHIEYVCEHEWTLAGECFKCGTKMAEAYRLPAISHHYHKDFRRPA
jgi:hypothetical protein